MTANSANFSNFAKLDIRNLIRIISEIGGSKSFKSFVNRKSKF